MMTINELISHTVQNSQCSVAFFQSKNNDTNMLTVVRVKKKISIELKVSHDIPGPIFERVVLIKRRGTRRPTQGTK